MVPKVSYCIAVHNMEDYIGETIRSCMAQCYKNVEVVVYDDCSTDLSYIAALSTRTQFPDVQIKVMRGSENVGVGNAFNKAIAMADGDYIILMCADDIFADKRYTADVVDIFISHPEIGHVSRYYYQFINGKNPKTPVREWATNNVVVQANNPSGLAFTRTALVGKKLSNKMFVESAVLVNEVCKKHKATIIPYHAVAVRVHDSTSTQKSYHKKYWSGSPLIAWMEITGWEKSPMLRDFTSLIQIRTRYSYRCTVEEVINFIKYRPKNLLHPAFWFYSICVLVLPTPFLRWLPRAYRRFVGNTIVKSRPRIVGTKLYATKGDVK